MSVRAKFRCHYKEKQFVGTENETALIRMSPVYGGSEENKEFFRATPCGDISFYTVNKAAAEQIEQGKDYYIDITLAE
jgi:hypothetical protein